MPAGRRPSPADAVPDVMRQLDRPTTVTELHKILGLSKQMIQSFLERAQSRGEVRSLPWQYRGRTLLRWALGSEDRQVFVEDCHEPLSEALGIAAHALPPLAQPRVHKSRYAE